MGDMIWDTFLDCGHINHDKLPNANKRPIWMVGSVIPEIGAVGECGTCGKQSKVIKTKLIQGWGD